MKVIRAKTAGFCFGVKRAVNTVYEEVEKGNGPIYTYGPIIHNEEVVRDLEKKGVAVLDSPEELETVTEGTVIIRSHGVAKDIYDIIEKNGLHLVDTPYVLMIMGSFSVFNLILCRTFFINTLPIELQEAAEIDGCNMFQYFVKIVLPLSKAIIAIMALYYAVGHWNSFFNGMIYVTNMKLYPLQVILRDILISGQSVDPSSMDPDALEIMKQIARTIKYGVMIVSSLPVLIMYPFVQKYFVKGVMIGSVKG